MKVRKRRNLRVERWKRAIEIAKILFEDQGYHSMYLDDLLDFALREVASQEAVSISPPSNERTRKRRRKPRCR